MSEAKKHKNLVNKPAEAYQIPVDKKVNQLLEIAQGLPTSTLQEIVEKLKLIIRQKPKASEFSSFLLAGPVMSDSQSEEYKSQRKSINQWRKSQSF